MPATARRSKSEAYEKGVREGKAMAARSRTGEPPEQEEEEEMDMGMQPDHSRKRSAKGAKNTKPAADGYGMKKPMDAECGCSGKKGGKCDGNCGSMRKRSDSLTPQEYLAACDLGIQDRSTSYIRARLDTAEARADLKCGNGAISEGEKCTKGPAQKVQPKPAAGGGGIAGAFRRAGERRRQRREFEAPIATKFKQQQADIKVAGKAREAKIAASYKKKRAALKASGASRKQLQEADMKAAMQLAQSYDRTRSRLRQNDQRTAMRLARGYDRIQQKTRGRRDSVWADGFSFDSSINSI